MRLSTASSSSWTFASAGAKTINSSRMAKNTTLDIGTTSFITVFSATGPPGMLALKSSSSAQHNENIQISYPDPDFSVGMFSNGLLRGGHPRGRR